MVTPKETAVHNELVYLAAEANKGELSESVNDRIVQLLQDSPQLIHRRDIHFLDEIQAKLEESSPASQEIQDFMNKTIEFVVRGEKHPIPFKNLAQSETLYENIIGNISTDVTFGVPDSVRGELLIKCLRGETIEIDASNKNDVFKVATMYELDGLMDEFCKRMLHELSDIFINPTSDVNYEKVRIAANTFLNLPLNQRCAIISRMKPYQLEKLDMALPPKESLPTQELQDARDQVKEYLSENVIWIPFLKKERLLSDKDFKMKEGLAREFFDRHFDWQQIVSAFMYIPFIKEMLELQRSFNAAEIEMLKEFIHARDLAIFRNQLASAIDQPGIDFSQPYETWKLEAEGLDAWMAIHEEKLKELKTLDLLEIQIYELPAGIQMLTKLELLYLMGNRLTRLPQEITQLKKLEKLFLGHNRFKEIPKELRELKQLEELYLESNEIQMLPEWIKELISLKELLVYDNKLKRHPAYPAWIKELEERGCKVR